MSRLAEYGSLFREAYAVLHGGHAGEPPDHSDRRPGESLEEYLNRSRSEALDRLRDRLEGAEPPPELRDAHELLSRLLASSAQADEALSAQVEAYRCGNFDDSISHSDRLAQLVSESARLDRELILALWAAEESQPGTLEELGVEGLPPPETE